MIAGVSASRATWLSGVTLRTEVTQTFYDIDPGINGTVTGNQLNLRKRVAATTYEHIFDGNDNTYNTASFYSYDIHGNVKQLWQYNGDIPVMGQELKTMHYYYDLVSGKVNSVAYNPGEADQYFHRYEYDADNRITKAYTWEGFDYSTIGWNPGSWENTKNPLELLTFWPWDEDGRYFYYRHGPLSRTEIGDLKVQGLDYIYTIHGWIKAVNSNTLADSRDPGLDGCNSCTTNPNQWVARDAMSYMLDYYSTDYTPIGGSGPDAFRSGKNGSGYGGNIIDLFNGNISGMTTTLKEPTNYTIHPQGTEYYYDQLNRLVEMTVYQDLDRTTNDWDTESPLTDYHEEYTYDANGNILSLLRNGHNTINTQMDDLTYNYATNNNKLQYVDDAISSGNYPTDIDDQAANNYDYDQIGNLIEDVAEEIANIDWTVYGKVKSVTRTMLSTKPELSFTYGPDGQRVTKRVDDGTDIISTYYVRDASGNIMATYKYIDHSVAADEFLLEEHHIYGSTRLGTRQKQTDLLTSPTIPPDQTGIIYVERGYKRYELTNHLGNVLTVVSDRRQQGSCTGLIVDYYEADIINAQDYYPFGAVMPEREWSNGDYRFGFNGMERTEEIYGSGNEYSTEFRQYDPRLGRWLSLDPRMEKYPSWSPFSAFGNNPIYFIDPKGDSLDFSELVLTDVQAASELKDQWGEQTGLQLYFDGNGYLNYYKDSNGDPIIAIKDGEEIGSQKARELLMDAINNKNVVSVVPDNQGYSYYDKLPPEYPGEPPVHKIGIDRTSIQQNIDESVNISSPEKVVGIGITAFHELIHFLKKTKDTKGTGPGPTVRIENKIRKELGYNLRENYGVRFGDWVYSGYNKVAGKHLRAAKKPPLPKDAAYIRRSNVP